MPTSETSPVSNAQRVAALARYKILDTPEEPEFDNLARLAGLICETPIALITLLDARRQWFKSRLGIASSETPIDQSFCRYAITQSEPMVVPDATQDDRFSANPLVTAGPRIRFYAGAPLVSREGVAVGTLCVIDSKPRPNFQPQQQLALKVLAQQVIAQMELRSTIRELSQLLVDQERSNRHMRELHGLFPLCPSCRIVKTDEDYWQRVNAYLSEHSELRQLVDPCADCKASNASLSAMAPA